MDMDSQRIPYTAEFLADKPRHELASFVAEQRQLWPKHDFPRLNISKTKREHLFNVLTNPQYGFTRLAPEPRAPSRNCITDNDDLTPLNSSGGTPVADVDVAGQIIQASLQAASQAASEPSAGPVAGPSASRSSKTPTPTVPGLPVGVNVYLVDNRFNPTRKTAVRMSVDPMSDLVVEDDGARLVSAETIVAGVRESICILQGPLRFASPFRSNNTFLEYFGLCNGASLDTCIFKPSHIFLPENNELWIVIEKIADDYSTTIGLDSESPSSSSLVGGGLCNEPVGGDPPQLTQEEVFDTVVSWLKSRASATNGYRLFEAAHGRVLHNPDIIRIWKFVEQFHDSYYRVLHPATKKSIQKRMIRTALNLGETSFNDALDGSRLARIYGPGGSKEDPSVVTELAKIEEPPQGRVVLLDYLRTCEKAHL
ncbi:hypothetical protein D9613_010505 [Agrocybe pediades]|uniref:Uncharacterized protein n=1 Tax=Agrocybe pediades TaxID=84607 RepID=A0A8H4QG08_9AGAR|nr:hypothetical protein D9613_010505 [Agrocybe pediades]